MIALKNTIRRVRLAAIAFSIAAVMLISTLPAAAAPGTPRNIRLSWLHDPLTTLTVTWDTDQGVGGYVPQVKYGLSAGGLTTTVAGSSHPSDDGGVDVREVELTGLQAESTYYYQAGDASNGFSQVYSFNTPPLYNTSGYKFCAFGDTRNPMPLFESGGWDRWESVANAVDAEKPLFNLFGADFTLNTSPFSNVEDEWNNWFSRMYNSFGPDSVFMSTHGNHEKYSDSFFERFAFPNQLPGKSELTYSFDIANSHFVCVDTGTADDSGYDNAAQDAWLRTDLQSARARGQEWIFVSLHRAPYSADSSHGDQSDIIQYLVPIFDEYQVDVVFAGHVHAYERSFPLKGGKNIVDSNPTYYGDPDGTIYCLTGSGGAPYVSLDDPLPAWVAKGVQDKLEYCSVEMTASNKCVVTTKEPNGTVLDTFTLSKTSPPVLTSITPASGFVGSLVTLKGSNFGGSRGSSGRVAFGLITASSYDSWSDTEIKARVPDLEPGTMQVRVDTAEGSTTTKAYTIVDDGGDIADEATNWYFAEGTCRPGFDPYICIQNPTGAEANVTITYMLGSGKNVAQEVKVPAWSRKTVRVKDKLGEGDTEAYDFSASVVSPGVPIMAERPMYFNYKGMWSGGHDVVGANAAARQWYFAEGSTRESPGSNFHTWLCLQNPGNTDAGVKVTYVDAEGKTSEKEMTVKAKSRATACANWDIGPGKDMAMSVSSTVPLVTERPMYFNYGSGWTDGHCVVGATEASSEFYFAEGTCRPGFDPYICVQNPGSQAARVEITYMLGNAGTRAQTIDVAAHSRSTVRVKDILGEGDTMAFDFSARVKEKNGKAIIAERPMYFSYGPGWSGGHCVIGARAPGTQFYFAEGTCRPGFESFLCIQNPGETDAAVTVVYMLGGGENVTRELAVKAHSRQTIRVKDVLGEGDDAAHDFSARVTSGNGAPIVVERPMYFSYGPGWTGGHCVVGYQ
ncbi:MAG: DUF5719 family protein [Candidatus Geothermincolia bacterium]